jgi:hypothetical protein
MKSVSHPVTMPILENNYRLQIIEIGFAEQFFLCLSQDVACIDLCENHSENNLKKPDLSNDTTFSLFNTCKYTVYTYTVCKGGVWGSGTQQTDKHLPQSPFTGKYF